MTVPIDLILEVHQVELILEPQGSQGPPGATGTAGADGADGSDGAAGADGAPGADGKTWHRVTGAPGGGLGVVGDFAVDDSGTGNWYEKTGASAWTLRGTMKGPQGEQGVQGVQGVQGDPGADGADGEGVPTGGTTGQFLRKQSGTDFDAAFAAPAIGEVTGLQTALDDKQPLHANLTALAGLVGASDRAAYFTATGALSLYTLTAFGRQIAELADASAARTLLGLVLGTDVQAQSAKLQAIHNLTWANDKGIHLTGTGSLSTHDQTAFGRTLAALADAAAGRTALGVVIGTNVQAFHANLSAFAGLTLIADRLPYANGSGTLALATFTALGRTLAALADAAAGRTALGLVIGTDVLPVNDPAMTGNPTVPTQAVGNDSTRAASTAFVRAERYNPPRAFVGRAASLTLPTGVTTNIGWDTDSGSGFSDANNWHSTSVNPSRFTVGETGHYDVIVMGNIGAPEYAFCGIRARINGSTFAEEVLNPWAATGFHKRFRLPVSSGQFIEVGIRQESSGDYTLAAGALIWVERVW